MGVFSGLKSIGRKAGAAVGGVGGASLGAAIGTAIMPGIGTAVGAALGGGLGSAGGAAVGGRAQDAVEDLWREEETRIKAAFGDDIKAWFELNEQEMPKRWARPDDVIDWATVDTAPMNHGIPVAIVATSESEWVLVADEWVPQLSGDGLAERVRNKALKQKQEADRAKRQLVFGMTGALTLPIVASVVLEKLR